jgi:hypothetical protein
MQSPFDFIVRPEGGTRYANVKKVGDVNLITSSSQEDHRVSNRVGIVVEVPVGYDGPIHRGDKLIVHHNVFKFYYDMHGNQRSSRSYFKDDLFFVGEGQYYLYGRDDKWVAVDPYCFVEPIESTDYYIHKPHTLEPLIGRVLYTNKQLIQNGIFAGSVVCFTPESEYEFSIDSKLCYRMKTSDIAIILDDGPQFNKGAKAQDYQVSA